MNVSTYKICLDTSDLDKMECKMEGGGEIEGGDEVVSRSMFLRTPAHPMP
jgi:hypothetical protein